MYTRIYVYANDRTRVHGIARNVFLQGASSYSLLAKLSLLTDSTCLSLSPLAIRDSAPSFILAERTASLFFIPYSLFFILYIPVCLGRQTRVRPEWHNASRTGSLPTRAARLIFPIGPRIAPRTVPSSSFLPPRSPPRARSRSPSLLCRSSSPVHADPASFLSSSHSACGTARTR